MTTEGQEALDPKQMFRPLGEIVKSAPPLEPLWGYFLFKKAITSIVGDPGVCKTTMGYGLAYALSRGEPFLDIRAEEPVKVLYMDFESSDSLIASRSMLVFGDDVKAPNFYVYNIVNYYLDKIIQLTCDFCRDKGINLIIVDNQSMAFNTRDENDNAEAIRQMRFVRQVANECNAAEIVFHHTSKANLSGTRKGTGAFARARLADVCINISTPSDEHRDIVCLETVKNRMVDESVQWYIKKEKGKFVLTDPPLGVSGQPTDTKVYNAQWEIMQAIDGHEEYKRKELVELLQSKNNIDVPTINNALLRLVQQRRLKHRYGYYSKLLS